MKYLLIQMNQQNGQCVRLEIPIEAAIENAINMSPVKSAEFDIYDSAQFRMIKGKGLQSDINKFKIGEQ